MIFIKILIWTIVSTFAFVNTTYANPDPSITQGDIVTTTTKHCSYNCLYPEESTFALRAVCCTLGGMAGSIVTGAIGQAIGVPLMPYAAVFFPIDIITGACGGWLLSGCKITTESELELSYPAGPIQERMTEEDDSCPICLENFSIPAEEGNPTSHKIVVIAPCKHKTCEPCFKTLLKSELTEKCPLCRREILNGDKIEIFQSISAPHLPGLPNSKDQNEASARPSTEDDSVGSNTPAPDHTLIVTP